MTGVQTCALPDLTASCIGGNGGYGGNGGNGGTVTISGGTVTAARIGGGDGGGMGNGGNGGGGGTVTISGGSVTADRIGGGNGSLGSNGSDNNGENGEGGTLSLSLSQDGDSLKADEYRCTVTATGAVQAEDGNIYTGDLDSDQIAGKTLTAAQPKPAFASQSLLLSGQIGVVFFVDLTVIDGVDYSDSYMTFSIPHGPCTKRADYANAIASTRSSGRRGFVCYINSIQMAEPITAIFHYTQNGAEKTIKKVYKAEDYFTAFDNSGNTDPTTIALVHALADFGHYVQPFLAEARGWTLGADYAEMTTHYTDNYNNEENGNYNITDITDYLLGNEDYRISVDGLEGSPIKEVRQSLTLDSGTAINVYFIPEGGYEGGLTASVNGGEPRAYTKDSEGRWCVKITGIPAHELRASHQIEVETDDGGSVTVTVTALSYVCAALEHYNNENDRAFTARNAVAAIYVYSRAADEYKAAHPNG